MTRTILTVLTCCFILPATISQAAVKPEPKPVDESLFELRIYHANPGKLDDLLARFRDHTCDLFTKHGMTNVAYFVPDDKNDNRLIYLLQYPSRKKREESWKAFLNDLDWKTAFKNSRKNGPLINKVESQFLTLTDYSPEFPSKPIDSKRIFELRTYTATKGNLKNLHARFRDHTVALFKKHGITNIAYFNLLPDQAGSDNTLIYLIAHKNKEARQSSFQSFAKDPAWKSARTNSEQNAGGSLTAKGGVKKLFLSPTDFSPLK